MVPSEAVWILFAVIVSSLFAEADEEGVFVV